MNKLPYQLLSGRFGAGMEIRILTRQTARVFGIKAPRTAGLSAQEVLHRYAVFTADAAARAIESGQDLKALRRDLFRMACRLGTGVRRWLAPRDERECQAAFGMLYRNIGIAIREVRPGEFCVSHCYFSSFYTPEVCRVISAIDQGIYAGIFSGGKLVFRQRITEGEDACRAFVPGKEKAVK